MNNIKSHDFNSTNDVTKHLRSEIATLREQKEQLNKQYLSALLDAQQSQLKAQDVGANLKLKLMEIEELRYLVQNGKSNKKEQQTEFANHLLQINEMNRVVQNQKAKIEELQGQLQLQQDLYNELKKQNQVLSLQLEEVQPRMASLHDRVNHYENEMHLLKLKDQESDQTINNLTSQLEQMMGSFDKEFDHYEQIIRQVELENEELHRKLQMHTNHSKQAIQPCHKMETQPPLKHSSVSFRLSDRHEDSEASHHTSPKLFCTESFISDSDSDTHEERSEQQHSFFANTTKYSDKSSVYMRKY